MCLCGVGVLRCMYADTPTNVLYVYTIVILHSCTICVQIFTGHIFRERPTPNNFRNFNFANGGLQLQTCSICVHIFTFFIFAIARLFAKFAKIKSCENLYVCGIFQLPVCPTLLPVCPTYFLCTPPSSSVSLGVSGSSTGELHSQ